jgi:hypothetical protein
MGPKVFINCAGFIKIDTNSLGDRWVVKINIVFVTAVITHIVFKECILLCYSYMNFFVLLLSQLNYYQNLIHNSMISLVL